MDAGGRPDGWSGVPPSVPPLQIRDFNEVLKARVAADPAFPGALLRAWIETLIGGDVDPGKAILRATPIPGRAKQRWAMEPAPPEHSAADRMSAAARTTRVAQSP